MTSWSCDVIGYIVADWWEGVGVPWRGTDVFVRVVAQSIGGPVGVDGKTGGFDGYGVGRGVGLARAVGGHAVATAETVRNGSVLKLDKRYQINSLKFRCKYFFFLFTIYNFRTKIQTITK